MTLERRIRAIADICAAITGITAGILVSDSLLGGLPIMSDTLRICLIATSVTGLGVAIFCLWKLNDLRKQSAEDKISGPD